MRILVGPFAGSLGTVTRLDGRGAARVLLGTISTRVDLADLEPIGRRKTKAMMSSSHLARASGLASTRRPKARP